MTQFLGSRCVLAVRNLEVSTRYYTAILGFARDPTDAPGWSFLSKDAFRVMLGECKDALPAGDLGDHSWFAHVLVSGVDAYHDDVAARGGVIISPLATKPWGLREFVVRTPDGHRIVFGQELDA
jgi:catechol 2,3-dioxygenase-like lactoylglutathione lyase family enzyme